MSASCFIHPLDLVKVRLQLHTTLNPGTPRPPFISILAKMVRTEGPLSIYAGLSASLLRQSIYGTTRLGLFRTISNELKSRNEGQPLSFAKKVFCGMTSGSIAVAVGTPCDVALVRMQSDTMSPKEIRRGYKNVFDALFRIVKEEGILALYSGLLPNILRGMAVNVGMMAFFDQVSLSMYNSLQTVLIFRAALPYVQTKELIQYVRKEDASKETSRSTLMMSAAVAGFTNCCLNLPMDNIKSRLRKTLTDARHIHKTPLKLTIRVCTLAEHGSHYRGVWHVVQTIVQKVS